MTMAAPTIRLLVCGSADRGDDGAPLAAVARLLPGLTAAVRAHLEIRRCVQLDVSDIVDVPTGEACIVLDTVVGIEPGDVVTMSLPELAARAATIAPRSSRALPIDQVLGIAEAVRGGLPPGAFVGIGGHWFGFGTMRSRVVRAGLPNLQAAVTEAIDALLVLEKV
jgi:Ni,Fe-hydrogenase maturation factor